MPRGRGDGGMIPSDVWLDLEPALRRLTEKQRHALLLVCYHGYTQEEAAEMCGVTQGPISRRIKTAACKIRDYMAETA